MKLLKVKIDKLEGILRDLLSKEARKRKERDSKVSAAEDLMNELGL